MKVSDSLIYAGHLCSPLGLRWVTACQVLWNDHCIALLQLDGKSLFSEGWEVWRVQASYLILWHFWNSIQVLFCLLSLQPKMLVDQNNGVGCVTCWCMLFIVLVLLFGLAYFWDCHVSPSMISWSHSSPGMSEGDRDHFQSRTPLSGQTSVFV